MCVRCLCSFFCFFFFFNDTATTEIYTLSLHDALPICFRVERKYPTEVDDTADFHRIRSEEHTSELQSRFGISYAVFCLKKKKNINTQLCSRSVQCHVDDCARTDAA